ncbi:Ferripyoverdine receptor precursor [Comamonas terrigena]|nr:Ferripyoverdine receptor precursor [Comamonas terrigena]
MLCVALPSALCFPAVGRPVCARTALALACLAAALPTQAAEGTAPTVATLGTVDVTAPASATTEGSDQYLSTAPSATATGLALRSQDTPQPVQVLTRSLLNDQDAQSVRDLAVLSAGLSTSRGQLYARGFALSHWMVDGMSVSSDKNFDLSQSLALYDRVEVVQGASGLMSGMGTPSAALNLVRKLPTAQPRVELQLRAGRWNQREAMVDASGPLNAAGSLRARAVVDANNHHSYMDRMASRKRSYYGVVEADIAAQTTLRLGASQQRNIHRDSLSEIPTAPDGGDLHLPRSTYLGYDWEYWQQQTDTAFAQLEHEWDSGWSLRADLLRLHSQLEYLGTYLNGGTPTAMRQSLGQYNSSQEENSYAVSLRGPWRFAGRTHQLALGLSHRRGDTSGQGWTAPNWITGLNVYAPMTPVAAPNLGLLSAYAYRYRQTLDPTQTGVWLATQLQLHERLQLTLGGRWDRYRHAGLVADNFRMPMQRTDQDRLQHFSRYAGLVWELDARHSAYLQTSDIFQPRTERDMAGQVLPSTTGRTYGAGLQGRYLDQRLQAGIHLFQATQRHALEQEYQQFTCPSYPGVACYRSIEQVRSRGVTLQLQGQITPGWQLSASTTLVNSRHTQDPQKQGQRYEPQLPRLQWQLSTVYRLPDSAWRVGGSLYRQSSTGNTGLDTLSGYQYRIRQPSYTLVGLMAARQITPHWQLQLNVHNLLDKRYYRSIEAPMFTAYGPPRSWQATLRYQY